MNKPVFYIICLLAGFIAKIAYAQENLVPNGSFEEYEWCPYQTQDFDGFYINACKYWTSPSLGTPDYFNECSSQYDDILQRHMFSVPENYAGNQNARTGKGYAGMVFTQDIIDNVPSSTYGEYIQVKLNQRLKVNTFYKITFYCSLADMTPHCVNSIGALLTHSELAIQNDLRITDTPQYYSSIDFFFCDTNIWHENTGILLANGGEEYLTIGVFREYPELKSKGVDGQDTISNGVYWYIDDVSLIQVDFQLFNVFTPNSDLINDEYFLDLKSLGFSKATILNRWGNTIIESNSVLIWDGTFQGKPCTDGVYFLKLIAEDKITTGYIHLIR